MADIQQIKQISIRDYLAQHRIKPKQQNPHYGLYLSPLRGEHTPSFKVDYAQNLWYDFGLSTGGSIIDLVMRLERCDFMQAVRSLGSDERIPIVTSVSPSVSPTVLILRIVSNASLRHAALLDYLRRRSIVPEIACTYALCDQWQNILPSVFRTMPAAGRCTWNTSREPKQITTIDNRSDTVIAFEGFVDFLSHLSMKHPNRLRIDAVVLNSIINLSKAISFLERHSAIHAFFDNDDAGRKATTELKRLCPNPTNFYRAYKDLDKYLLARRHRPHIAPMHRRDMKM